MKRLLRTILHFAVFLACLLPVLSASAQEGPLDNTPPKGITSDEIIQRFAAKEKEFKAARDQYTYRQDITVKTLDGSTTTGEYHEVFDVLFDDKGRRLENVVFAPQSSLEQGGLSLDEGDVQDFRNKLPFVLTTDEIPEYNIIYVGQQSEDELHCYAFDIAPKQIVGKKRYFQGRIWVDDHDFQIVKTYGQAVPEIRDTKKKGNKTEHLYPKFTTWRQQIDGKYWFPVYTRADDTLHFNLNDIHIREVVKYEDYKRFGSSVKILYQGQEIPKGDQKDQKTPPDQAPDQKKPDAPPNPPPK
jgi:outer membrane lipoprotein-sorting protein